MKLEINQLTKSYSKGKIALDSFTLTLEKGVYGILGPNGAGKSTLINCVTGIIKPDSGSIAFTETVTVTTIYRASAFYHRIRTFIRILQQESLYFTLWR